MITPAIIWDLDGTLVDTAAQHFRAWYRFTTERQLPFTKAEFAATFGMRNPEIIRKLWFPAATDAECQVSGELKESYYRELVAAEGTDLLPGVATMLAASAERGWHQAVGSSAPSRNLELLLSSTSIRQHFAAVVSGDDVTRGKPEPDVFLQAAAKLAVQSPHCVVIEDALVGVKAAKAAGMACVAVTFASHASAEQLRNAGADLVVPTLAELDPKMILDLLQHRT